MAKADADLKSEIQEEADQVSAAVCELNSEMAACCEQYGESLAQQLASLKERAVTAKGESKEKLANMEMDLRIENEKANAELEHAYASYVAALNADMDHMKKRLSDVDEKTRNAMVKAIERRQASLDETKQKLQKAKG